VNVLFLTCHLPFPASSGGRLREFELLRRLGRRHRVEVCAVTRTLEHDRSYAARVRAFAEVRLFGAPPDERLPPGPGSASFLSRRTRSAEAAEFVASRLAAGGADLVHCEGFYMAPLVGGADVPVFLMEQNVEYRVWPGEAAIRAEELRAWRSATRCGALTRADAAVMRKVVGRRRVLISFNGSDHATTVECGGFAAPRPLPRGPLVVCPGNFAYEPSYEAGASFCTTIGPAILERVPDATLVLVGNASESLLPLVGCPRIEVHGAVASLEPYYAAATVVACPLGRGGGIKVKLLEALARGCAIVSTRVGRQGLEEAPMWVADSPERFAASVAELLTDHRARAELRARAAAFGAQLPTWNAAAERLDHCWNATVRARRACYPAHPSPGYGEDIA
jgi:hypothetical protein